MHARRRGRLLHADHPRALRRLPQEAAADAATSTEAIYAITADSREAVDELADTAIASGGAALGEPQDQGFMYTRAFDDPDGHHFEVFWMDPAALEGSPEEAAASTA